ncbi:MAG: hypothetical protein JST21_16455 [Bacteroidetes bacterium]|nr:hypothetical protein [Bacteroidota bacterium]
MNKFDAYLSEYLNEHKEVSLEKIGTIKINGAMPTQPGETADVLFTFNKKASTTAGLIDFIAEHAKKNKSLVTSDLESHFTQAREFINIGKNYEIINVGFIKANNSGEYEFLPYAEANKSIRITSTHQPAERQPKTNNRSLIQMITLLIVLAILGGLGYEAYHYFINKKNDSVVAANNIQDTVKTLVQDTAKADSNTITASTKTLSPSDTVNVRYIFETTASILRARTRTEQLNAYGNHAGFDSFMNNNTKFYSLFIINSNLLSDTAKVRDSISKYLQKPIRIELVQQAQ